MHTHEWQLSRPIDAVIFDCDGTLSRIEGIEVLAAMNGIDKLISEMTKKAMAQSGLNQTLYQTRLDLIRPTLTQLLTLGQQYYQHKSDYAEEVIAILHRLNKSVFIVSAGLLPAVKPFGQALKVREEHIIAVNLEFNADGGYHSFDHHSPLIDNQGKKNIVQQLKKQHPHIAHIGDGLNDIVTKDMVTRFIGFGGHYYRENIKALSHYYLTHPSLLGMLPLLLTEDEVHHLTSSEHDLYLKGLKELLLNN